MRQREQLRREGWLRKPSADRRKKRPRDRESLQRRLRELALPRSQLLR